jgi:hypothetical protein
MWTRLLWTFLIGVIFGLTGISMYWMLEPSLEFTSPIVKMITQTKGDPVAIDVVTDNYLSAGQFSLQIVIATSDGTVVKEIDAAQIFVGKKYYVLTGADLQVGSYEVYAVIRYKLNPLRNITEYFVIAVLRVEEMESGT